MRTRLLHTVLFTDPKAAIDTGHAANDERHGALITPGIDDYLGEYAGI